MQSVMHQLAERALIKGGFVWVNTNGIKSIEVFARKLTIDVIDENQYLFGMQQKEISDELNKDCLSSFKKVIKQLGQLNTTIIFIIENCEGLIEHQVSEFKEILSFIQKEAEMSKIVLTSTMRLKDSNEDLIVIDGLNAQQSVTLFRQATHRLITIKEEQELFEATPGWGKQTKKRLYEHELWQLIGGNPQSILLIAPMLNDHTDRKTLLDIYKILKSDKINRIINKENMNIGEGLTASMRISMEAAFKKIEAEDEEALDLFFIVSLFAGGV